MSIILFWTIIIAMTTALACSICGVFLVIKREAFISEGLSHAVLPGIILAFVLLKDRNSPLLIIVAGLSGLLMVWLVQLLCRTKLIDKDASLGIVFSALFSVGVVLASLNLKNIHFHEDCIINGDLAYAPLKDFRLGSVYLGPKAFVIMASVLTILIGFITLFYKELKILCFDEPLAKVMGFRPVLLHAVWLGLVSITAVAAFDTAGTILVVALMIAPAAAANLLTDRLWLMLVISALLAAVASGMGVLLADFWEVPPASPIASLLGILFVLLFCFSPKYGVLFRWRTRQRQNQKLLVQLIENLLSQNGGQIAKASLYDNIFSHRSSIDRALETCRSAKRITIEGSTIKTTA
ncbi:MAG: metal ABC transporter permease [Planctomycetota bacterium]